MAAGTSLEQLRRIGGAVQREGYSSRLFKRLGIGVAQIDLPDRDLGREHFGLVGAQLDVAGDRGRDVFRRGLERGGELQIEIAPAGQAAELAGFEASTAAIVPRKAIRPNGSPLIA